MYIVINVLKFKQGLIISTNLQKSKQIYSQKFDSCGKSIIEISIYYTYLYFELYTILTIQLSTSIYIYNMNLTKEHFLNIS